MNGKEQLSTRQMAIVALMTALMCLLGPVALPIGAVPISLTTFVIFLTIYLLGVKLSLISYFIYLLLGMSGLPVFSGFSGGLTKLVGPTGGYLIGFLFMIIISGALIDTNSKKIRRSVFGMTLGTLASYLFGTAWFLLLTECNLLYALTVCVFPFLIGDGVKILLAAKIGLLLHNSLRKAGLLPFL